MPGMIDTDEEVEVPPVVDPSAEDASADTKPKKVKKVKEPKAAKPAKVKKVAARTAAAAAVPTGDAGEPIDLNPVDASRPATTVKKTPKWLKWVIAGGAAVILGLTAVAWGGATDWQYITTANAEDDPTNQTQSAIQATDFSQENLESVKDKISAIEGMDGKVGSITKYVGYEYNQTSEDDLTGTLVIKFAGTDSEGKEVEFHITIENAVEPKSASDIMDAINNAESLSVKVMGEQQGEQPTPPTPVDKIEIADSQLQDKSVQDAIKGKNIGKVTTYMSSEYSEEGQKMDIYFSGLDGAGREAIFKSTLTGVATAPKTGDDVLGLIREQKPSSELYTRSTSITQGVAAKAVAFGGEKVDDSYEYVKTSLENVSVCATAVYDADRDETRCKSVKVVAVVDGEFVTMELAEADGLTFSGELSQEELDEAVLARFLQMYSSSNESEAE